MNNKLMKKFTTKKLLLVSFAVLAVFALIILWMIFDSDEYKESASEKREEELAEAEAVKTTGYTEASVKVLTDAIAAAKILVALTLPIP